MKKKLLLITSTEIGDTGKVGFRYIFQDKAMDAYKKYPEHCSGLFGLVKETDTEGTYYINAFEGGRGFVFAMPLSVGDVERNKESVEKCFPDAFSLLCTKQTADALITLISDWVDVEVLFSEQTLLTS